jgi:chromosome segregation ATPase
MRIGVDRYLSGRDPAELRRRIRDWIDDQNSWEDPNTTDTYPDHKKEADELRVKLGQVESDLAHARHMVQLTDREMAELKRRLTEASGIEAELREVIQQQSDSLRFYFRKETEMSKNLSKEPDSEKQPNDPRDWRERFRWETALRVMPTVLESLGSKELRPEDLAREVRITADALINELDRPVEKEPK